MSTLASERFMAMRFQESDSFVVIMIALAALGCHLVFQRYEPWHPAAHFGLLVVLPGLLSPLLHIWNFSFIWGTLVTFAVYLSTLCISIVVYRLFPFHPLARYPGPLLCKLTKFRSLWFAACGKQHLFYKRLHDRYGVVVRVGPNELSFSDPAVIVPMMGPDGMPKSPYWDGRLPGATIKSLIAIKDPKEHACRRRPWNRAFSIPSLKEYETIIAQRATQLFQSLADLKGSTDFALWLSYFIYDFMNDMTFGGGSELMRDGDSTGLWYSLQCTAPIANNLGQLPWLGGYWLWLPGVGRGLKQSRAFATGRVTLRQKEGSSRKDLFYHLIDEGGVEKIPPTMREVLSDAGLAIRAGADTTSSALSNLFWLLCHPSAYRRLQAEVDKFYPTGENALDPAKHAHMHYLSAVINESLRLYPPVNVSHRASAKGSGGHVLGQYFVPEGTNASVHFYSIHRDPLNFSPMTETFWPDRWLPPDERRFEDTANVPDEIVHNTTAFVPFSYGPAICVGKILAYHEIRMVVCLIMQRLEICFEKDWNPQSYEKDLRDYLVLGKAKLPVIFSPRVQ